MRIPLFRARRQRSSRKTKLGFEQLETRRLLAVLDPVNNTSSFPASATVQIKSVWDTNGNSTLDSSDTQSFCSGAMISRFQVLSAGHCVFDSDEGGFADWVFAHPGRRSAFDRPFGEVEATEWTVPSYYASHESNNYDVSIITLDRNIGDFTGWFGYTTIEEPRDPGPNFSNRPQPKPYHLNVSQYPADHGYSGYEQFKSDTSYVVFPQSWITPTGPRPFFNVSMKQMWTAQGSSGSPLYLDNGQIVGVLSNGDDVALGQSGIDHYVKINSSLTFPISWITSTLAENSPPTDRPVIVNQDQWFDTVTSNLVSNNNPHTGDSLQVKAPLFNAGTARAQNVKVRFRLSTDDTYDKSDILLGDATVSSIGALQKATASLTVTLPSVSARAYYVVWRIDPDNSISEFDVPLNNLVHGLGSSGHHSGKSGRITVSDDGYESNNTRSQAFDLGVSRWLSSISGRGVQYNDDYYRIRVPSGQLNIQVSLKFEHKYGDIDLDLLDSSGRVLVSSRGTLDTESINTLLPSSGDYFLRVFYGNAGNTYDLRWDAAAAADLVGKDINFTTQTLEAGQAWNLHFTVQNNGGSAGQFRVRAFISRDASIDPSSDVFVGSLTIAGVNANQSTSTQTLQVRLPAPGSSFWNGDGEYFVGIAIDDDNKVIESNETNNYSRGLGLDVAAFQVVVHPYGTFTVTTTETNRIALPQFDRTRGTLNSVEVVVTINGFTGVGVFPNTSNTPIVDSHPFAFSVGAFAFAGTTIPMPRLSRESHVEQIVTGVGKTYAGAQLQAFLDGAQQWAMPSGLKTGAGLGGHTHAITQLSFVITTKFLFTPPPADLRATNFTITNGPVFNGKDSRSVHVDFALENLGPGPAPRFKTSFYISQDPNITASDTLLSTYEYGHGMASQNQDAQSISLTLPHASSSFWTGNKPYYLGMIIDTAGEVTESNRANNSNRGMAIDQAIAEVIVKPPGTDVSLLIENNQITLPKFDSTRGVLRKVEGNSYILQGLTNTGGTFNPNIPQIHSHTFSFALGPFDFMGLAVPMPSGQPHPVVPMNLSRVTITDAELAPFLAGTRTLTPTPKPVSTSDFGHTHTLDSVSFYTELWYTFDVLPNLHSTAMSVSGNLFPSGKGTANFNLANDSAGDAHNVETQLWLVGPDGMAGSKRLLGQTLAESLVSHGSVSQSIPYTLPAVDDEFWAVSGQYRLVLMIDPDNEIAEANEADNSLTAAAADFVNFPISLRQQLSIVSLPMVDYHQHSLNLSSSDQWYRVEPSRTAPLTSLVTSTGTQPVRQTLYKIPAALHSQISTLSEQAIRPYVVNQAPVQDGISRIDVEALVGDLFLLRIAGDTPNSTLTLANVLEKDGTRVILNGSELDDILTVTNGPTPLVSIGPVQYGLDRGTVSSVDIIGGGGRDQFLIQALPTITVNIVDSTASESMVVDATRQMPSLSANSILIDQGKPILYSGVTSLRLTNVPLWQNLVRENDVNNDGLVTAIDALLVINQLNVGGPGALPSLVDIGSSTDTYLDPSGDQFLSAIDALLIINQLNNP